MPAGFDSPLLLIRMALRLAVELGFVALDAATSIPTSAAVGLLVGALVVWLIWARVIQAVANLRIAVAPDKDGGWKMELVSSAVSIPVLPLLAFALFLAWLVSKAKTKDDDMKAGVLTASHGPVYLTSALTMAALLLLSRLTEPVLGSILELSDSSFTWSYVLFGWSPGALALIPLFAHPGLALVVATVGWGTAWWLLARVLRVNHGVWRNLYSHRDDADTLPGWRRWGGFAELHQPAASYLAWAFWTCVAAVPLVLLASASAGGEVYRLDASALVVGALLVVSQVLNVWLRGIRQDVPEAEEKAPGVPKATMKGWDDVLADLGTRLQAEKPPMLGIPVPMIPLPLKDGDPFGDGLLSPMLKEVLPAGDGQSGRLTEVQELALREISAWASARAGRTLAAPSAIGLGGAAPRTLVEAVASRVVVAPEGTGRTLLTRLAACNHVLTHTRTVLVVLRDDAVADAWRDGMDAMVLPSTLRWNVRVRRAGVSMLEDLARGVLPDVLVCSVRELVTDLLVGGATRDDFLRQVGLIVVDDADSFIGPVEMHAHLAFQRLHVRLRELQGIEQTRKNASLPILAVMGDSMHDPTTWIQSLLGTEVAVYQPVVEEDELAYQEAARAAAAGDAEADATSAEEAPEKKALRERIDSATRGRHHLRFRIADMNSKTGRRISVADVVASCERLAVPWHYRTSGDGRRHIGRSGLRLEREPRFHVDEVERACVVFFEGEWSAVVREMRRLPRAGATFSRFRLPGGEVPPLELIASESEPIALLSVADPDADMVFTESDRTSGLAPRLAELPHPVVRPPLGAVARAHLGADLVGRWIEVEDVIRIYGREGADALRGLASRNMLHAETRRILEGGADVYQDTLLVHATADAVRDPSRTTPGADASDADVQADAVRLPPPTQQVETALVPAAVVRDGASNRDLFLVDRASAVVRYYPGRRFQDARGRFVVVGVPSDGADPVVQVEPVLDDSVSSPRRQIRCAELARAGASGAPASTPIAPLSLGNVPLGVRLMATRLEVEHLATMQLGPVVYEVRQRQVAVPRTGALPTLDTEAVWIHPYASSKDVVGLTLGAARLVAAAMRMVLPVYYRAGDDLLGVALQVYGAIEEGREDDYVLAVQDAFVVYDMDALRNGAAQALRRDGIETLLRLTRLVIERVLYHDRLRTRFDEWTTPHELLRPLRPETRDGRGAERSGDVAAARAAVKPVATPVPAPSAAGSSSSAAPPEAGESSSAAGGSVPMAGGLSADGHSAGAAPRDAESAVAGSVAERAARESRFREAALVWLDSILAPEGGTSSVHKVGEYPTTFERGEGDRFDRGRCWYAVDSTVANLVWTRHRWRGPKEEELSLDCGFDRATVANARTFTERDELLAQYIGILAAHAADPVNRLPDGTIHGMPRGAFSGEGALSDPARVAAGLPYFGLVFAVAANDWLAVAPLARALARIAGVPYARTRGPGKKPVEVPEEITDPAQRHAVTLHLARFVQGIRYAVPEKLRGQLRPPVSTVIYRVGDCDSRSTLLALLLRAVGIDAGMFVSFDESHAVCAAAVPLPIDASADPATIREAVRAWSASVGVSMPLMWAVQPTVTSASMAEERVRSGGIASLSGGLDAPPLMLYVPIECTDYKPVGEVTVAHPDTWVFLPFSAVWKRINTTESADPTDRTGLATDDSERGGGMP